MGGFKAREEDPGLKQKKVGHDTLWDCGREGRLRLLKERGSDSLGVGRHEAKGCG